MTILKEEGPLTFYKGLLPTLIQIAPYSGLQFGFYAIFTKLWQQLIGDKSGSKIGKV